MARITWSYWLLRQSRVSYAPYRLWIEPTNKCNLACVMCPNKDFKKSELGYMDWDMYQSIIDQAEGVVHDVNLHHRGESTLHPRLVDMIRYASQKGMKIKLHTNGSVLNKTLAQELIRSGLNLISFSFDGYTSEVYEKIRIRADFKRTTKNIMQFLEIKQASGRIKPRTVIEMIDFQDRPVHHSERQSFIRSFKSRGLDRLIIKHPHNWAGNISTDSNESDHTSVCTFPWHALVILWDGRVGACPHDFFAKIIYGDIQSDSLKHLFNGEKIQWLRDKMLTGRIDDSELPCNGCDSMRRKRIMGIPIDSLKYLRD